LPSSVAQSANTSPILVHKQQTQNNNNNTFSQHEHSFSDSNSNSQQQSMINLTKRNSNSENSITKPPPLTIVALPPRYHQNTIFKSDPELISMSNKNTNNTNTIIPPSVVQSPMTRDSQSKPLVRASSSPVFSPIKSIFEDSGPTVW
jgi:hypothetical protein